ncbi:hypothetical protein DEU56DRAFT_739651 [Suillus clintonianus]|uniref:uncharacterized protein n=1 Tax=Suillus clintonianus TaxID=1904413 RepID=UPI001B874200|nr:uncharacterized protein DEU56DRAFT_739651 [Suillus clintonianus]KAG2132089.1 hypothetical protein DEU56DRAFT_739651 [Suillus clintonianus]
MTTGELLVIQDHPTKANIIDQLPPLALRSSPPFPSPGSSFLPPPTPGPHEFAPPSRKQSKKDLDDIASSTAANGHACSGQATPNGAVNSPNHTFLDPRSRDTPSPHRLVINPDSHDTEDPKLSPQPPSHSHRLSTQSVTSLTSSRPAPPSPAISRRASGLSRTSSKSRSRPVSGINSRPLSNAQRPVSAALSPSAVLSRTPSGPPTEFKVLIKIRDFAFAPSDPRFSGEGPNVPRLNRPKVLARRLRGSSSSTSSLISTSSTEEEDDQWEDENDTNGWGGFKWGFQKLQSGWGLGSGSSSSEDFPSRTDFARNFGDGGGDDDESEVYEEPDEFSENQDDDEDEDMLYPGLYRALYSFDPEGTAEMKLDEDQVVRVVGRGGGVGWAVVVKEDTGVHALVPESYLEVVKLDGDDDD